MTPAIDSAIPLSGATDPTALTNSPRAGMSFADICAAQLSQAAETQTHISAAAPTSPSNSSMQTGNTPAPANPAPAKGSAKNAPGSNPVLALLVPLPSIVPPIELDPLTSSPTQPLPSLDSGDSGNQSGGFDGTIQITSLAPASGTTTAAALPPSSTNVPTVAAPIMGSAPEAKPTPEMPASAVGPTKDPGPLSSPIEPNAPSSSAALSSPSLLPNAIGAQGATLENVPDVTSDDPGSPDILSATPESFETTTKISSQDPVPTSALETPAFSPDVQPPAPSPTQPSATQVPAAQISPAAIEVPAAQEAAPQNVIQAGATLSSQTEEPAPADAKASQRSAVQSLPQHDREALRAPSVTDTPAPKTIPTSSAVITATSHIALPETQPVASALRPPAPVHASSNSAPISSATPNTQNLSAAETNLAVPTKCDPASHQLGNAPPGDASSQGSASSPGATPPVSSSESSSSKKDSGSSTSDSDQSKNSSNAVAAAANSLPVAPSPAFTSTPPSAQVNVSQPSSLPDAGARSNSQTSATVPDSAPRSSLPSAADAPAPVSTSPLQWVQMANKAGQAEMRIGWNTAEFGSVEVRTSVHASDVGVQIGSEKGDLRSLLTPELPSIANTLQQQDLRLAQVSFHQQGFSFTGNSSFSGGNSQQRSFASRPQSSIAFAEESSATEVAHASQTDVSQRGTGLSILA